MSTTDDTARPVPEDEAPCGPCGETDKTAATSHRWADLALGLLGVGFGLAIIIMGVDLATGGAIARTIGVNLNASSE